MYIFTQSCFSIFLAKNQMNLEEKNQSGKEKNGATHDVTEMK
jgi:hypothetical protein